MFHDLRVRLWRLRHPRTDPIRGPWPLAAKRELKRLADEDLLPKRHLAD